MRRYVTGLVFPDIKRKSGKTCSATQGHIPEDLDPPEILYSPELSDRLRSPISLLFNGSRGLFYERKSGRGLKLATDLLLLLLLLL
jgi:hypothetical protein